MKKLFFESKILKNNFYSNILTSLGKEIINYDEFNNNYNITNKDIEGWNEYIKASTAELDNNYDVAIKHYMRVKKLINLI